jgi:hypothetical protein
VAIAWTTIAGLVLLLPGFLFFLGLAIPEKFSRETGPQSVIGQLASVILVSLAVHCGLILTAEVASALLPMLPEVDLELVLGALNGGGMGEIPARKIAANLEQHFAWVASYLFAAAILGLLAGWFASSQAIRWRHGWLGFPLRHRWTYDLVQEPTTVAYVLTKMGLEGRYLIYRGLIAHFGLRPEGRFSYIALKQARRMTRRLIASEPVASQGHDPTPQDRRVLDPADDLADPEVNLLHIDGEEIANVVFERYSTRDADPRILDVEIEQLDKAAGATGAGQDAGAGISG